MVKERLAYFDNIKGVLIILVVIGHLLEPYHKFAEAGNLQGFGVLDFIYLFHMPLFIFVTGLFSKRVLKDGRFRAEVPLFYLALCFGLYAGLMAERMLLGASVELNFLSLNGRIPWYLMVAALYVLGIPFFARLKPEVAIGGAVVAAVLSGLVPGTNILSLSRAITFLPIFLAGYYAQPQAIISVLKQGGRRRTVAGMVAAVVMLVLTFAFFQLLDQDKLTFCLNLFYGKSSYAKILDLSGLHLSLWLCAAARIVFYGAVALIGACLFLLIPVVRVPLLTNTGSRSLQVYILHPFVYYALNNFDFTECVAWALPDWEGVFVLVLLGGAIALILGLYGGPQRGFDALKVRIAHWVDR